MQAQGYLSLTIAQLVEQLLTTRRITRNDQQRLMAALLSKAALSSEEQIQVNRVFDSLKQGYIRVVD
jgi:hypothetical protein